MDITQCDEADVVIWLKFVTKVRARVGGDDPCNGNNDALVLVSWATMGRGERGRWTRPSC